MSTARFTGQGKRGEGAATSRSPAGKGLAGSLSQLLSPLAIIPGPIGELRAALIARKRLR